MTPGLRHFLGKNASFSIYKSKCINATDNKQKTEYNDAKYGYVW